ncbi:plasmid pRiA4b ORF-3 family protein [Bacillus suaedaesalsae]|uniref:Plasmid pRiA4b ORF-3 family protein n=1 Tax=Bacillus suaedaesalsae TaxID=2810349 RepID=A0ABS2DKX9_9BACI|nr:plasmid pRiA4b ORF-3 family protein [Bacillus suaedaesalsae]MBM6619133.1 plasmid pRiA4b ORF-3 family protein [Bacillus suaedaesalsae]
MLIQCTKKLLTELKLKPEPSSESDSLFSWHANIITLNRKKTIVLVNDQSRYIIVLYSVKAADLKRIDQLLVQAIRDTFCHEGIKDEVIENYLSHFNEVKFSTTKDRKLVARLNKACENVCFYEEEIHPHGIQQPILNKQLSRLIVGNGKNDYITPSEELFRNLEGLTGGQIFHSEAYILHVTLELENHEVWRRIAVPKHITFPDLHKTLQISFGWQDCHLHEFSIYKSMPTSLNQSKRIADCKPVVILVCHEEAFRYDTGIPMKLEEGEKLHDYLPSELRYTYDLGDEWNHQIVVEQMMDNYDKNYPTCFEGRGNTPPGDVGGEPGFEEFLSVMADPAHPDYEHLRNWGISQGYEDFNMDLVNRRLKFF